MTDHKPAPTQQAEPATCVWFAEEEATNWRSECGVGFVFNDDGPRANGFKFCFKCGKPLDETPAKVDEFGDLIEEDEDDE